jgi:hypothetical protein
LIDRLSDGSENQEEPQTAREGGGGGIAEVGTPNFKIMHEERDRGFYRVVFFAGKE